MFVAWSSWGSWTCSVTCGRGAEIRSRRCMFGNTCRGNSDERRTCNKQTCPGENIPYLIVFTSTHYMLNMKQFYFGEKNVLVWSSWGSWTCSVTCGQGTETRSRRCQFGNNCVGNSYERRTCNKQTCPGKYIYSFDASQIMQY